MSLIKYWKESDGRPKCHFTPMEFQAGEWCETWWECKHCGHTVPITPERGGER